VCNVHPKKLTGNVVETLATGYIIIALSYSFNNIPPLIFKNAHAKSVKHTGLGRFDYWKYPFVLLSARQWRLEVTWMFCNVDHLTIDFYSSISNLPFKFILFVTRQALFFYLSLYDKQLSLKCMQCTGRKHLIAVCCH